MDVTVDLQWNECQWKMETEMETEMEVEMGSTGMVVMRVVM